MIELKKEELQNIEGGGFGIALAIGAAIVFLIGIFDGFTRPYSCRK